MNRIFFVVMLFLILLSTRAYPVDMGFVIKNDFSKINFDESAKFTVLFWNTDKESYDIELSSKIPEDWIIFFEPNNFVLNETTGKEYIKLPYQSDYTRATPIDIIVKPPSYAKPGNYTISVKAKYTLPQNGISLSQERLFNLSVEIANPLYLEGPKIENKTENNKQITLEPSGKFVLNEEKTSSSYFYAAIIFVIALISVLIYKYS